MEEISNRSLISRLYSSANKQLEIAKFDNQNWLKWYEIVHAKLVTIKNKTART